MRRVPRFRLALVVGLTAALLVPATAAAQFRPKLPGKVGKVLGVESDGPTAVPTFNDRTIEINEAHVTALATGLRMQNDSLAARWAAYVVAKKAYDDSMKAYPARQKAYEQQRTTWEACQEREVKPASEAAERDAERAEQEATGGDPAATQKAMEAVAERVKAAQQRGDMQEVMRLADSIQKVGMKSAQAVGESSERLQRAAAACGVEPEEPRQPREPVYDRAVLPIPQDPALWASEEQYAIMFDRLDPLLAIEKQADFDKALRTMFSANEQAAIGARAEEIRAAMARRNSLLRNG